MARIAKSCILQCVKNPTKKINLPHNKKVYLGRNEETMITDTELSRKQVAATADYDKYVIKVEAVGLNFSGCNGYVLRKNGIYDLKHGDRLELRLGCHEFDVLFHPPPDGDDNVDDDIVEPEPKRTKLNYPLFNLCDKAKESSKADNSVSADNASSKNETSGLWENIDNGDMLIYSFMNVKPAAKIAAFDLDGTLIKTKSGLRFAKNSEDWVLNFSEISQKISDLFKKNYKIVVFTNQGGVKSDQNKVKELKIRIESVLKKIKVPMQVFASTGKNIYRKPAPGMWDSLVNERNDGMEIDITNSFYVGDAAGREKNWAPKKNKDHSIGDRLFAINIGLKFYTPEEYFLGARSVSFVMPKFDPRTIKLDSKPAPLRDTCEVIIMVGSPGSGKSHYCKENIVIGGYAYANRDTMGSWQACVKMLEKSLQRKQSVVIDNTNPDKTTRKRYIDVIKKYNVPCRCFLMNTSPEHSKHNNRFRELTDKTHTPVGEMILNMFKKNFEEPSLDEGFEEIVKIDFIPKFDNSEHEKLYRMFLLDS